MIAATVATEVKELDWTAIVLALISAVSASFAAWQGRLNSKALKENKRMLQTNTGKTIGEHIEHLHGELALIAQEKVKADADLASAALAAMAKLAIAEEPPSLSDRAMEAARVLVVEAQKVATLKAQNSHE